MEEGTTSQGQWFVHYCKDEEVCYNQVKWTQFKAKLLQTQTLESSPVWKFLFSTHVVDC